MSESEPCSSLLIAGSQDPFQMLFIPFYQRVLFVIPPSARSWFSLETRGAAVNPAEAVVTFLAEWRCREIPVEGLAGMRCCRNWEHLLHEAESAYLRHLDLCKWEWCLTSCRLLELTCSHLVVEIDDLIGDALILFIHLLGIDLFEVFCTGWVFTSRLFEKGLLRPLVGLLLFL